MRQLAAGYRYDRDKVNDMKFFVTEDVFRRLGTVCFGVVIARDIDNSRPVAAVSNLLEKSMRLVEERYKSQSIRSSPPFLFYREAFQQLGMNPNKFMSSIEAMTTRIAKGKLFPSINPVVDLANAVSLKYGLPMGAHDIDRAGSDVAVRFSRQGDVFVPFGETEPEFLEDGELIYSVGEKVKTRRWIWRQSEQGKVTEKSRNVFFPIDGFTGKNDGDVLKARDELAGLIEAHLGGNVRTGFVDENNPEFSLS
jgi:DNA/RNA-binding domain of Phe-tRNA-synthetase-like protein